MRKNMTSRRVMISAALVAVFLAIAPMISTRRVGANTFTVTNLNDSGMGSLRQAILDANSNAGDDTIDILVTAYLGGSGGQSGGGGGISSPSGTVNVINSAISNNHTGNGGTPNGISSGGGGINNNATLNIINSTISSNQTGAGGQGGGIDGGFGTVTISNSTITANTAAAGKGGGIIRVGGVLTLKSAIVAGNSASTAPDIDGSLQSDGFNLIQNTSGTTINQNPGAGPNITGQDPLLGPLTNNGGSTDTHALNATSPAIDKGKNFATNSINTDQRGHSRPVDLDDAIYPDAVGGDTSDIGAFESEPCTCIFRLNFEPFSGESLSHKKRLSG